MSEKVINKGIVSYGQVGLSRPIRGSTIDSMYPELTGFDLREQFQLLLDGSFEDAGIGRPVIYRKLSNTTCKCFVDLSGSPDPNCSYCDGEGYLFTEEIKIVYLSKNFGSVLGSSTQINQQSQTSDYGVSDSSRCLAFMFWYDVPDYERYSIPTRPAPDKLFELKTLPDGEMDPNQIRTECWRIRSLTAHHGDNGRVEFFELGCEKVTV